VTKKSARDPALIAIIALMYVVGVIGHTVAALRPRMLPLTPVVLATLGILVLAAVLAGTPRGHRPALATWVLVTYAVTFAVEALGVATGAIFGAYSYGGVLGPAVAGVPLVIGFNWVLVVLGAVGLAASLAGDRPGAAPLVPLAAGALTVAFDWVMEPVAVGLGYWTWADGIIPLQNYAAWFLVGTAAAMACRRVAPLAPRLLPAAGFGAQLAFFAALRLVL
jgi:bisanhydrobacterioruberin hydratase